MWYLVVQNGAKQTRLKNCHFVDKLFQEIARKQRTLIHLLIFNQKKPVDKVNLA